MGKLPFYKVSQASSLSRSLAIDPLTSTCKNGNKQKKMDTHTEIWKEREKKTAHFPHPYEVLVTLYTFFLPLYAKL